MSINFELLMVEVLLVMSNFMNLHGFITGRHSLKNIRYAADRVLTADTRMKLKVKTNHES